jgi:hypothetical protein
MVMPRVGSTSHLVVVAGKPLDFWPVAVNGDWIVTLDESGAEVVADYRLAIGASEEIVAMRSLDDPPAQPEGWWSEAGVRLPDLRAVLMHVLVETSTHAGQLDAVRELLDGRQYVVM